MARLRGPGRRVPECSHAQAASSPRRSVGKVDLPGWPVLVRFSVSEVWTRKKGKAATNQARGLGDLWTSLISDAHRSNCRRIQTQPTGQHRLVCRRWGRSNKRRTPASLMNRLMRALPPDTQLAHSNWTEVFVVRYIRPTSAIETGLPRTSG